jgi:hypothetical protein
MALLNNLQSTLPVEAIFQFTMISNADLCGG